MKKLLVLILTILNLSGCAGYWFSKNGKALDAGISSVELRERGIPENAGPNDIKNGTQRYDEEMKWCGLTLWAIIPIPLSLPVCRSFTEITFENGHAVKKTVHDVDNSHLLCGPGVWFAKAIVGDHGFCQEKTFKE